MNKNTEIIQGIEENFLRMPYSKMLWLRLEFMTICEDEIEALILRVMEYEIEGLRHIWLHKAQEKALQGKPIPEEPEHWWVSLSYKQFMVRLYGVVKNKKTIIDKLNKLTNDKQFLLRRTNPDNEFGAPQYTINKKVVQDKLDQLPSLSPLKAAAKSVENEVKPPVPASGTPHTKEETTDPYQLVVPPIPASGTPHTSSYHTPVPVDGGGVYQLVVPVNNSKKLINNNKETQESVMVESANADIDATHNTPSSPPSKKAKGQTPARKTQKSNETEQPSLIEIPAGPPIIPAKDAPWTAETIVQIVEAKRGERYEEIVRTVKGKKYRTQRQRQLEAAQIIIDAKFTREQFEKAYDHRFDAWWIEKFKELTVEHMTKNTSNGTMRLIEELEKCAHPVNRNQNRSTSQGQTVKHGQRPEDYEKSPISQNNTEHLRKLLASRGVASAATAETKGA